MTSWRTFLACGIALIGSPPVWVMAEDTAASSETLFTSLDRNGDGQIAADEVTGDQKRFYDRLLRVGDKDSDGSLSKAEFIAALREPEMPAGGPAQTGRPSPEEMQAQARERFRQFDRNQDGKLTPDEFPEPVRERIKPLLERLGKDSLTEEDFTRFAGIMNGIIGGTPGGGRFDPSQMIERLDQNGDGKIAKTEIPELLRERVGRVFEAKGKDELTREEFAEALRTMMANTPRPGESRPGEGRPEEGRPEGPMREAPRLPALMRVLDTNGDGRLSKDELSQAADHFAELDRDNDGSIDLAEAFGPPAFRPEGGRPDGRRPDNRRPDGERPEMARPEGRPEPAAGDNPFFSRMDSNGDGKVSRGEAPLRLREVFDRMDQDLDGFLTPQELRRGFERGIGNRPQSPAP